MYVKQINQDTALELCKKGIQVNVLIAGDNGEWQGMIPDTLQNILDRCTFFRSEPALDNQEIEKALADSPQSPPHQAGKAPAMWVPVPNGGR